MAEQTCTFISSNQSTMANRNEKKNFILTDEETALLINIIIHYKSDKLGRGIHWNTVREKFNDITKLFIENYPADGPLCNFPNVADLSVFTDTYCR